MTTRSPGVLPRPRPGRKICERRSRSRKTWISSTGTTSRQEWPWRRESRGAGLPTERRRPPPETGSAGGQQPATPPARPLVPLASFFDAARRLVWPADAPTHGDFAAKKSASDAKTLELLEELERKGYARISTAADARTMLLNYGQPALQFLRDTTTPRLSDAFHIFLMSLYDSIGQTSTDPAGN